MTYNYYPYYYNGIACNYRLTLSPAIIYVVRGETARCNLQIDCSTPYYTARQMKYYVTGLGPGMSWTPRQGNVILINISPSTPSGTYSFMVVGSAYDVTYKTSGSIIVQDVDPVIEIGQTTSENQELRELEEARRELEDARKQLEEERKLLEEEQRIREEEERLRRDEEQKRVLEEQQQQINELIIKNSQERMFMIFLVIGVIVILLITLIIVLTRRGSAYVVQESASSNAK